jgi:hypothetical protein
MSYARNMPAASKRHYVDAESLFANDRFDNAGYHYGFSAECALKAAMGRVGITFDEVEVEGRTAYYMHFPELRRIPVRQAGRLSQKIAVLLANTQFLQEWHIKMRYAPDRSVSKVRCEIWRQQVLEFNNSCMGI